MIDFLRSPGGPIAIGTTIRLAVRGRAGERAVAAPAAPGARGARGGAARRPPAGRRGAGARGARHGGPAPRDRADAAHADPVATPAGPQDGPGG